MLIRRPKDGDFHAMAEIKVRGWQTAYHGIIDEGYLQNLSIDQIYQALREKNDLYLVAEANGGIIGFCRYRLCEEPSGIRNCYGAISELYVQPKLKRMGIGGALFRYVLDDLKESGSEFVCLSCFSDNTPAISFYLNMNGEFIGKEKMKIGAKEYSVDCFKFVL